MKNSLENKSDDLLKNQYKECLGYIDSLNKTLEFLPSQSVLGRLSINMTIKRQQIRLDGLKREILKRGIKI